MPRKTPQRATQEPTEASSKYDDIELQGAGLKLWEDTRQMFRNMDPPALRLLWIASVETMKAAEMAQIVSRDGALIYDRFGSPKRHPATVLYREHVTACQQALAKLNLLIDTAIS